MKRVMRLRSRQKDSHTALGSNLLMNSQVAPEARAQKTTCTKKHTQTEEGKWQAIERESERASEQERVHKEKERETEKRQERTSTNIDQAVHVMQGQCVEDAIVLGPLPRLQQDGDLALQVAMGAHHPFGGASGSTGEAAMEK